MIVLPLLFTLAGCTTDDPDVQSEPCNCQSASLTEAKNVEAVVVFIRGNNPEGNQGPDLYILSTASNDFTATTHTVGPNILVPCDSLSTEFRKQGERVIVSYKRKKCYGAITQPTLHGMYGYFINLRSIRKKG